jgi:lactate dehydrogenase-like 2-hydroxyacid dehydrogenase
LADLKSVAVLIPGPAHPRTIDRLEQTFEVIRAERADPSLLSPEQRDRIRGIASFTPVNSACMDALPQLEIVANFGVGYDFVDAPHAGKVGVMVTNTPDVLTEEVADTALGLLLCTARDFCKAEQWVRQGRWEKDGPFPLSRSTLRGRKVGIFGLGRIGQAVGRRLEAFGLEVAYHSRRKVEGVDYAYFPSLIELATHVDTLISIAPGTPETEKAVNRQVLEALGPQGIFISMGRGSTVDEDALIAALSDGTIMAAGLDVFRDEPRVPQALIDLPNATLFPHVGSSSQHTRGAMADLQVDNLISWFSTNKAVTPVPETAHVVPGTRKG